jgi:hypothetical protein
MGRQSERGVEAAFDAGAVFSGFHITEIRFRPRSPPHRRSDRARASPASPTRQRCDGLQHHPCLGP